MNIKLQFAALGIVGMTAAFGEVVEVPADSAETMGMIKISKTNAVNSEIVFGVPFMKSPSGDTNTVNTTLVAGYGADFITSFGDLVKIWNPTKPEFRGYDAWETWPDEQGGNLWLTTYDGVEDSPEASTYIVNRGAALWFTDISGDTNDLVQAGLVKPGAQSTVAAGTATNPKMTLLVNPYGQAFDANALITSDKGAAIGDQLALTSGSTRYEFGEDLKAGKTGWGSWVKGDVIKIIGKIKIYGPDKFVALDSLIIPAGKAFWYISKGGSPTVDWD